MRREYTRRVDRSHVLERRRIGTGSSVLEHRYSRSLPPLKKSKIYGRNYYPLIKRLTTHTIPHFNFTKNPPPINIIIVSQTPTSKRYKCSETYPAKIFKYL